MATDERTTGLRRFFERLTASDEEMDALELQRDVVKCGAMPAGQCRRIRASASCGGNLPR